MEPVAKTQPHKRPLDRLIRQYGDYRPLKRNRRTFLRRALKDVSNGFFFTLGGIAATLLATTALNQIGPVRIEPLLQLGLALTVGTVFFVGSLVSIGSRHVRQTEELRRQIAVLKAKLASRPVQWTRVDHSEISLSSSHPSETVRYGAEFGTDVRFVLKSDSPSRFNADLSFVLEPKYGHFEREEGAIRMDGRTDTDSWEKTIAVSSPNIYYMKVTRAKDLQSVFVRCDVFHITPVIDAQSTVSGKPAA